MNTTKRLLASLVIAATLLGGTAAKPVSYKAPKVATVTTTKKG
jgi:hypothetical protein